MNYELGIMNYELEKTELGGWFLARRTLRLNLRGGFETVVSRWFRRFFRARAAVAWRGNDSRRGLLFLPSSAPRALPTPFVLALFMLFDKRNVMIIKHCLDKRITRCRLAA